MEPIKQCRDQGQGDREKYTYTQADERTHGDTDTDSQTYRQTRTAHLDDGQAKKQTAKKDKTS